MPRLGRAEAWNKGKGMNITALSLAVEIDGQAYFVKTEKEHYQILMHMVQGLSPTGKLEVVPAPADFKFTTMAKHRKESACTTN